MNKQELSDGNVPIRVYANKQKQRQLKAKLALDGETVSEWYRRKVDAELTQK